MDDWMSIYGAVGCIFFVHMTGLIAPFMCARVSGIGITMA
jgi:hypothetical protein